MTEPDADAKGAGRTIGDLAKDVLDDVAPKGPGPTINDAAKDILGDVTAPGGFFDQMGHQLQDVFVDKDGDGIPDVAQNMGKIGQPTELTHVRDDAKVEDFLKNVLAQVGDKYQLGAEASLNNPNPDRWDGSELVEWSANRAGVMVNDGAANQYRQLTQHGGALSVDDALHTPGAVLYQFTGDPINGQPTHASTAISLGDGRIVDIDPVAGVRIVDAKDFTFTHAGVMPGFTDAFDPGTGAHDVVQAALAQHGIDPAGTADPPTDPRSDTQPDTTDPTPSTSDVPHDIPTAPDTAEITQLADRAQHLRANLLEQTGGKERVELEDKIMDLGKRQSMATDGIEKSQIQIDDQTRQATDNRAEADDLERQARDADAARNPRAAEEFREQATKDRALANVNDQLADRAKADIPGYQKDLDEAIRLQAPLSERAEQLMQQRTAAETALDGLEDRVRNLRDANTQRSDATDLDRQAADLRATGDTTGADALAQQAAAARTAADAAQAQADAQVIDEAALAPIASPVAGETPEHQPTDAAPGDQPEAQPPETMLDDDVLGGTTTPATDTGTADTPNGTNASLDAPAPAPEPDPAIDAPALDAPAPDVAPTDLTAPSVGDGATDFSAPADDQSPTDSTSEPDDA